jgi:hypothetical protein
MILIRSDDFDSNGENRIAAVCGRDKENKGIKTQMLRDAEAKR